MVLYISNIPTQTTEQELNDLFSQYGEVRNVEVSKINFSGETKGVAFVTIDDRSIATKAMQELDGQSFKGKRITVNEARPRPPVSARSYKPRS